MAAQLRHPTIGLVNEDNWRDILRRNYVVLARIQTEHFVDELYQKCVLNEDDRDEIKSCRTRRQRATYLLDLLHGKGFSNFIIFLGILEIEYPDAFKDVTNKDPVKRPGRARRDRESIIIEVMPAIMEKLQAEMKQNKSLLESLQIVEESIGFLKEEKAELEIEVERYRIELRDVPQLREKFDLLSKENEDFKKEKEECSNKCLEYVREKETAERRFRELRLKTHDLQREVEFTKLEKENEKRKTKKWETICKHLEKGSSVDHEIEILRDSERELAEKNETLACQLWEAEQNLDHAEEDLRKVLVESKKCKAALLNSEENQINLEQRCEDTRVQVDRLRKEKDIAIKSQHAYFEMYTNTSTERDRLSAQLRTLESQYDSTKKQLDKLKNDMRSSLNSETTNLSSSINQWLHRLERPPVSGSGTSSDGSYSSPVSSLDLPEQRRGLHRESLQRSDTVSGQVDESEQLQDGVTLDDFNRTLLAKDQYDRVSMIRTNSGAWCRMNEDCPCSEVSIGSEDGAHQDFHVRCDQDSSDNADGQLPYSVGDILLITNPHYGKRDFWLAERVDSETGKQLSSGGQQLSPGGQHQGIVKATNNKDEKHVEKRKNPSNDQSISTINRRDAIRKIKAQEKETCPFTTVTCVKVLYPRPVVLLGSVSVTNIVTAIVSSNRNTFESWFNDKLNEIESRLVSLEEKTTHVILPASCLKLCYKAKINPICINLDILEDHNEEYLLSLFGTSEETEQQNSFNLHELKTSGIVYNTFEISRAITKKDVLVGKLITFVHQLQDNVVWLPLDKSSNQSDH